MTNTFTIIISCLYFTINQKLRYYTGIILQYEHFKTLVLLELLYVIISNTLSGKN